MIKFKVYVDKEDLKDVNKSSLLFDSNNCICDLIVGNVRASLIVNGEIRILNEKTDEVYKHYGAFTEEMKEILRSNKDLEDYGYIINMNNWFELFIEKVDENEDIIEDICFEVADIEGELDENNLLGSLFKFMANSLQDYTEYEDYDVMLLSGNDDLLIKKVVNNAYEDYKTLAKIKQNKENEEIGKDIYMNSNEKICWVEYFDNNNKIKSILVEVL